MKRTLLGLVSGLLLLAPVALADGLATGKPGMNVYPADEADRPKFPRAYPGAPPVMTHGGKDLRVTLKVNDCMDCHAPPESHFVNPFTGKRTPSQVVRYNCTQCHVPQALEKPPYE